MKYYKILLADDEEQFRSTIMGCFPWMQYGFEVSAGVSDGEEALKYIMHHHVDLIFSDIQMPVVTGIELAQKVSQMQEPPMIVFFSGYQEFEYAKKAMVYGVRNYIIKPVRFEELAETLTQVKRSLDSHRVIESESEMSFVEKVQKYVKDNLKQANLAECSEILHMNQCYVSQLYKQKTGTNFSDFVLESRMKSSIVLLEKNLYCIYDIAEKVGYSNPNNFTKAFRAYFGVSPKAYKKGLECKEVIK